MAKKTSLALDILDNLSADMTAGMFGVGHGGGELINLAVDELHPGRYQPRQTMNQESLTSLIKSVRRSGVIQPILVRYHVDSYEIIAGERRWRAAQQLGLSNIPAIVKEVSDDEAAAIALIENLQREDLNPIDEANALDRLKKEFTLKQQDLVDMLGLSVSHISRSISLLKLDRNVQRVIAEGKLSHSHARELLVLDKQDQWKIAQKAVKNEWTTRQLIRTIKLKLNDKEEIQKQTGTMGPDPDIERLKERISQHLGAPVTLKHNAEKGSGTITLKYYSLEECDGILAKMGVAEV